MRESPYAYWVSVTSSEPKVRDFDGPAVVHEQVARLEIPMEDPAFVAKAHGRQQLQHERFDLRLEEWRWHDAQQCLQIMLYEVHHNEHPVSPLECVMGIDENGTHCVKVSPTTTSRMPTTFSCLQTINALISRSAVIGKPCFSSSSFNFFNATMSPVSLSLARKTTP